MTYYFSHKLQGVAWSFCIQAFHKLVPRLNIYIRIRWVVFKKSQESSKYGYETKTLTFLMVITFLYESLDWLLIIQGTTRSLH